MSGPATYLGVAVAGAVGAPARYLLDSTVQMAVRRRFPVGTLVVNVAGSLLLGILTGLALQSRLGGAPLAWAGAGFCGGFTTFSTFAVETGELALAGRRRAAATNAVLSPALALGAAALGIWLGGRI